MRPLVQNGSSSVIYVAAGGSTGSAATQGDEALQPGQEWVGDEQATWVSVYGTAATKVNGTATGGLVIYGVG